MTKKAKSKPSQEFVERTTLLELQRKVDLAKHKYKMKEFAYIRETDQRRHEQELERGRIKSAEIRKMQERKSKSRDFQNYAPPYKPQ
jgi:hypothetical protein